MHTGSKALAAAVDLELFKRITESGADTEELRRLFGLHPRPAEMLLSACAALGLLVKRNGRYYNSPLAEDISSGARIIVSAVW